MVSETIKPCLWQWIERHREPNSPLTLGLFCSGMSPHFQGQEQKGMPQHPLSHLMNLQITAKGDDSGSTTCKTMNGKLALHLRRGVNLDQGTLDYNSNSRGPDHITISQLPCNKWPESTETCLWERSIEDLSEEKTIINICAPNMGAPNYIRQLLIDMECQMINNNCNGVPQYSTITKW